MNIGDKIKYVRQAHGTTDVQEGEGILIGIGLDPDSRPLALIKDGEVKFNTPMAALNPTPEFVEEFKAMILNIQAWADEARAKQMDVVTFYNEKITSLRTTVLGACVNLEPAAAEAPAAELKTPKEE